VRPVALEANEFESLLFVDYQLFLLAAGGFFEFKANNMNRIHHRRFPQKLSHDILVLA
jgi:hypothetical protein